MSVPVSNGDAVTVPIQPPCPTGSVDASIDRVTSQASPYQNGLGSSITYDLTISGTVTNRTDGTVRLAGFNPIDVKVGFSRAYLRSFFSSTLGPGSYANWTATSTWTQYNSYDKPQVTAKALGWTWDYQLYSACPAGSSF